MINLVRFITNLLENLVHKRCVLVVLHYPWESKHTKAFQKNRSNLLRFSSFQRPQKHISRRNIHNNQYQLMPKHSLTERSSKVKSDNIERKSCRHRRNRVEADLPHIIPKTLLTIPCHTLAEGPHSLPVPSIPEESLVQTQCTNMTLRMNLVLILLGFFFPAHVLSKASQQLTKVVSFTFFDSKTHQLILPLRFG